jgi:hypothetical protein
MPVEIGKSRTSILEILVASNISVLVILNEGKRGLFVFNLGAIF